MNSRKIIFSVAFLLFTSSFAFCQSEVLKGVVNSLAYYKKQNDLKYLGNAKKTVDSLIRTKSDSSDLEKNVYKALVYSSIVYTDSLNKLNQPAGFFLQTTQLVDDLSKRKKIYKYQAEMSYSRRCLGNAYLRHGFQQMHISDYSNALQSFKKAQTYAPSFREINAYIAYANNKLGNVQEAAKYYNILLSTDTIRSEYIDAAANTYKMIGDTAKALQLLQKGRKLLPNDKSFLLEEANIYNNNKNYNALAPLLPQLLDDNPNNADIAFIAANCYDHLNHYDKAESLYLRAIELNGASYDPVFNLGLLYCKISERKKGINSAKDLSRAKLWLEKANEISPNDTKCLHLLQLVYGKEGNNDQLDRINNKLKQLTNQ
ncbi:tetratricopeptide repeat protein [Mucilaginibacter boryungensis]|uniref:Tetratricopeptide repeat protein n=1 Tax=Mucilaginibacter boryungensis TaxID=768480 RepID=A0ABR9XHF1_9SPHI|nr:tetratricopeptide repeat protein [Mucilaginibacter boryungensis]MBE9666490.1 tetratricopeptide repeat protein [Mucilaginibacter boryungensis]